ncbi:peptidylprolyl isomerase [Catenovulum sp. 2E275]|uniref:peptidylprolyl isomerase n=1 Tax=Catenovulum sp. 2E275 TaxID=2980497 RepID=UPI0021D217CE|nr:peptidylprolyl isomerase [Catenovulum sp. 2E275]MCU4675184.1 peptidylprolyl isomerase [Catenovulum sp. 2E275]
MKNLNFKAALAGLALSLSVMPAAQATIVLIKTSQGDFEVNLYDKTTPETVANFLSYVESGEFETNIIHRSVSGFIIQSGGYKIREVEVTEDGETTTELQIKSVETNAPVINEPVYSNVRGTIAMAKLGGDENSATSGWFINLADNSSNLDNQNGGFTVFGEVTGYGMETVDSIADLPIYNLGSPFSAAPLQDYTETDAENEVSVTLDNFVKVESITVTDVNEDTAADLNPPLSTYEPSESSGGSFGFGLLAVLLSLFGLRKLKR